MSTVPTLYQTDSNGIWVGTSQPAKPDPFIEGRFLTPAGCVDVPPPKLGQNQAAQFVNGAWTVVSDFRNFTYWLADRSQHTITDVGVEPPTGYLTADPGPTPAQQWMLYRAQARALLDKSDVTVMRCVEHGIAVPAEWSAFRTALRSILSASTGDASQALPTRPAYPAGS